MYLKIVRFIINCIVVFISVLFVNPSLSAEINCPDSQNIVGTWQLIHYSDKLHDGTVIQLNPPKAQGLLIYSASGYMSVALTLILPHSKIPNIPYFYSGTYILRPHQIIHVPEFATDNDIIGQKQIRYVHCINHEMSLIVHGQKGMAILVWKKIIA